MNWLLIIIVLGILLLLLKLNHIKHKISLILVILIFLFIYLAFSYIASMHSIDLKSPSGVVQTGKVFYSWVAYSFGNLKTLTTNAVKMDWIPEGKNLSVSDLNPKNILKG